MASDTPLPPGHTTIRFTFVYDGGKLGAGGVACSPSTASKRHKAISNTNPLTFSPDETADVGIDEATAVDDYDTDDNRFTGNIYRVTIEVNPLPAGVRNKVEQADQKLMDCSKQRT
jgi:hypothetical protein